MSRKQPQVIAPLRFSGPLRDQLHQARFFAEMVGNEAPRRIGVVACHAGAGTSTVALNLAAMLRERTGDPTLLVETNVRHPVLADRWHLGTKGSANRLLRGELRTDDAVEAFGGVTVLAAEQDAEPLPLLRAGLAPLLETSQAYRHAVLDLPPAMDYPDATVLAPAIDALILVLEVEQTRWEVARQSMQQLEAAGIRILGAVLNKKPMHIPEWLYRLL